MLQFFFTIMVSGLAGYLFGISEVKKRASISFPSNKVCPKEHILLLKKKCQEILAQKQFYKERSLQSDRFEKILPQIPYAFNSFQIMKTQKRNTLVLDTIIQHRNFLEYQKYMKRYNEILPDMRRIAKIKSEHRIQKSLVMNQLTEYMMYREYHKNAMKKIKQEIEKTWIQMEEKNKIKIFTKAKILPEFMITLNKIIDMKLFFKYSIYKEKINYEIRHFKSFSKPIKNQKQSNDYDFLALLFIINFWILIILTQFLFWAFLYSKQFLTTMVSTFISELEKAYSKKQNMKRNTQKMCRFSRKERKISNTMKKIKKRKFLIFQPKKY